MIVYVESNFVLELVREQEEVESCYRLLELNKRGGIQMVIPVFCLYEPYQTLEKRAATRKRLAIDLAVEFKEIMRSKPYRAQEDTTQIVMDLLVQSSDEDYSRLEKVRRQLSRELDTIPFTNESLISAFEANEAFDLDLPDAIVYSSVKEHLKTIKKGAKCFLNRNFRDFGDPGIIDSFELDGCKLIPGFSGGLAYIEHALRS